MEAKNSFLESLVKIGEGFQEIFVGFGSAIGDVLGFTVVKLGDNRSKVGEHFKTLGQGLKSTKEKLDALTKEIVSIPHTDTTVVESVIKGTSSVIAKLFDSVAKLAGAVGDTVIGDSASNGAAIASEVDSVKTFIEGVKEIIEIATNSGLKMNIGIVGNSVDNVAGAAPDAFGGNVQAAANSGPKLAAEVTKADPWAMIDKIKNATTVGFVAANNNNAGQLATGAANANGAKAATNADLAAAVALKAMTKGGKFTQPAANEDGAIKAAAASAVNKVLGILDLIIRKAVNLELDKVKEAVKGIRYSETPGSNSPEAGTIQTSTVK
ncbi:Variable major protein (plasmid) [Borrelia crocidurae DOU]|uniref:Variable large protein n=1 Tax=Borrelia crocidurae DOU TaxID=1293575 RepID=W5SLU4_9SPIR|nr:Variable major protein [Borrelia crocidurae DOU]